MFKNIINTRQFNFLNSFKFSLFLILIFLILKVISSYFYYYSYETNIFKLSNLFGGYIESLHNSGMLKSCIYDNQFTIYQEEKIACSYASRMPIIPYLYSFFLPLSKEYFYIAVLKNLFMSLIFLLIFRFYYKKINLLKLNVFKFLNFFLIIIFFSPSVIKHASNISYEEGIILELLILWSLFFLLTCYVITNQFLKKNETIPILTILLSTLIYFTKASMLLCLILSILISIYWLKKEKNLKIMITIIISCSLILSWGYRNSKVSNSFNIGSSINWVVGYYGLNNTALEIYPEIALDQIFFAENFKLKNNRIINNQDNINLKFKNEWNKNDYYKKKSLEWIKDNPVNFVKITTMKFYNFFIYLKKTPYSVGPIVNDEYKKFSFQQIVVFIWLLFGRLSTLLLLFLIYKKWQNEKILCLSIILMCGAYAAPYLIGFNYERHITPFIIMTVFSNIMLYNANKNRLYPK